MEDNKLEKVGESTPLYEHTPPPAEHHVSERSQKSKLPLIIGALLIILLLVAVGGIFYSASQTKKAIKDLSKKQTTNFTEMTKVYGNILSGLKDATKDSQPTNDSQLLRASLNKPKSIAKIPSKTAVLGLEDSQSIQASRKLAEIYNNGQNKATDISDLTSEINSKINPMTSLLLPKTLPDLVQKTSTYAKQTKALMKYFTETNKADIHAITVGYDMGVALGAAIDAEASDESVKAFEDKVNNIKKIKEEYVSIDTSGLTPEIQTTFKKMLAKNDEYFQKLSSELDSIVKDLKAKDPDSLVTHIKSLYASSTSSSDIAMVDSISFLQENSLVRQTQTLQKDWEKISNNL